MAGRSLNKVQLIGNLTRDPELRYTPTGAAVCTFGMATNRQWSTDSGDKKDEAEFHKIVAWNKLAEICSQLLSKGRRVYIEGRLSTRSWTGQDGAQRQTTEIVASDMIILDNKGMGGGEPIDVPADLAADPLRSEASEAGSVSSQSQDMDASVSGDEVPQDEEKEKPDKKKKSNEPSEDGEEMPF